MQAPGGILVVETLQHIDTGLVVYYQAGVDTAGLDAAALLDRYRDYLGLASLGGLAGDGNRDLGVLLVAPAGR